MYMFGILLAFTAKVSGPSTACCPCNCYQENEPVHPLYNVAIGSEPGLMVLWQLGYTVTTALPNTKVANIHRCQDVTSAGSYIYKQLQKKRKNKYCRHGMAWVFTMCNSTIQIIQ